jgi:hypothetical protein
VPSPAHFDAAALGADAASAGAGGSSNLAPPRLAMWTTARPISSSLKAPPPWGGIAFLPLSAEFSSAS